MTAEDHVDGRLARGQRTRSAVLTRAADIASVDGLEGLSIGRLASDLGVSKAGVFTHFGSKQALQLSTVAAAVERFAAEVVTPALEVPEGLPQLWALCDRWLAYARSGCFPGGCFFLNVAAEFDARPGPVREAIAEARRQWLALYEQAARTAQRLGQIRPAAKAGAKTKANAGRDPSTLAFELDALGMAANLHATLCDDPAVYDRARASMLDRLRSLAIDPSALPEP